MAIVEDGKLVFACEEERLTGNKKDTGFPARSVLFGCKVLGIDTQSFDKVVYGHKSSFFFRVNEPIEKEPVGLYENAEYIDHHYAHAVSAYCLSGFKDCLVMTLDGGGDDKFGSIWEAKDGKLTNVANLMLDQYPFGVFYNQVTEACGFKSNRHEGKVMGLAAHGKVYDIFDDMFSVEGTQINSIGKMTGPYGCENIVNTRLSQRFGGNGTLLADVASSAQKTFEEVILKWIEINAKGRDLAVAGGSFANVLANMKIAKIVNRLFVTPPMFDGGLAVGAAFSPFSPLPSEKASMYLGFEEKPNIENMYKAHYVAKMISEGAVVGLFQGRMEFGPRALGNRSILADPRNPAINDSINKRLGRSEFMPFAPVILEEYARDILEDFDNGIDCAPHMTCCWKVKPEWITKIPAVVHIDGTVRPQVISKETNPYYYEIIDEFRKLTGIPVLVNTSFNPHEFPIVCFSDEAKRMIRWNQIDVLVEA
jgi:carbamoyltransferase